MSVVDLELPCGLDMSAGIVLRAVSIGKIKGKVQRDVARLASNRGKKKAPNAGQVIDAILMPTVKALGSGAPPPGSISGLAVADRDWLIFELHKASKGQYMSVDHECTDCEAVETYKVDIDTLDLTRLPTDLPWWNGENVVPAESLADLEDAERKKLQFRVLVLENEDKGARGVFRYPRGVEQKKMGKVDTANPIEAMWKLMSLCLVHWKDDDNDEHFLGRKEADGQFWDNVDNDILIWAQEEFTAAQPGLDTQVELECEAGHINTVGVSALDFLFPDLKKG